MRAIIVRAGNEDPNVAIVECDSTKDIATPDDLCKHLSLAITEWMKETNDGKEALEASSNDFNIGDLSCYVADDDEASSTDASLTPYLTKHGITRLRITTHEGEKTSWEYDDKLFDELELEDSEDDGPTILPQRRTSSPGDSHEVGGAL